MIELYVQTSKLHNSNIPGASLLLLFLVLILSVKKLHHQRNIVILMKFIVGMVIINWKVWFVPDFVGGYALTTPSGVTTATVAIFSQCDTTRLAWAYDQQQSHCK